MEKKGRNWINYPGCVEVLVGGVCKEFLIDKILNVVVTNTRISKEEILGNKRYKKIKEARQLFHYLANKMTGETLQSIGSFTNNSHCTVIHSIKTVENVMSYDKKLIMKVARLEELVKMSLVKSKTIKNK